jgi:hypothetical protein
LKREHRHERHVALVARLALPAEPRPVPHARDAAGQVDAVGPPQVAQLARSYAGQQPREQRQLPRVAGVQEHPLLVRREQRDRPRLLDRDVINVEQGEGDLGVRG